MKFRKRTKKKGGPFTNYQDPDGKGKWTDALDDNYGREKKSMQLLLFHLRFDWVGE